MVTTCYRQLMSVFSVHSVYCPESLMCPVFRVYQSGLLTPRDIKTLVITLDNSAMKGQNEMKLNAELAVFLLG